MLMACIGLFFFQNQSQAQYDMREIGTRLQSFDNFGIVYKKQTDTNEYTRYQAALGEIGYADAGAGLFATNFSFGLGWEKRVDVADDLQFVHGWNPQAGLGFTSASGINRFTINLAMGYILGAQYNISDKFYVSLETIPQIAFSTVQGNGQDIYNAGFRFNSDVAFLTFVYRFRPKN